MDLLHILPWADVPYAEQLERKQRFVAEAFNRRGLKASVLPVIASPTTEGARARIKLRGGIDKRLGFHAPGSHTMIFPPLERIARPEVVELAEQLNAAGGWKGEVELRSDGQQCMAVLDGPVPSSLQKLPVVSDRSRNGPYLNIEGLRVSPPSFYQVNLEINRMIVAEVDRHIQQAAPARLLDVYAGIGNLSAPAIRRGLSCTLIEQEGSSCADARYNFKGTKTEIIEKNTAKFAAGETFFDVALIDPPRAGAPGLLPKICLTRPRCLIYLSCNPVTLAKDLSEIPDYRVQYVQPYDMFPHTEHVETLVVLSR